MNRYLRDRGEGIRIGVVDSGVGPHPYLQNATSVGAVINGQYDPAPAAGADVLGHGSHASGIMIARPVDGSGDYCGIADGADVLSIRVLTPEGQASQADIADAIDLLTIEPRVDLINLSLGGPQPSQIEQDALRSAMDRGTLCVAAAGNDFGQPILYPAAYPEAIAVSAIGLAGIYPAGTMEAQSLPTQSDQYGPNNLFLARFSDIGPQMSCGAPGVGIISTVPARPEAPAPYAAYSGTSMAAPVVCASLATVLAQDQTYRGLPRNQQRTQWASFILANCLRPLGLNWTYAGGGLVQAWPS
jgi:subtilisin family serine protease